MQLSAETIQFIKAHAKEDVRTLALQAGKFPTVDMAEAVVQIAGRQMAEAKLPTWAQNEDVWYPRHLSMEQCSSEVTALYKASLVKGDSLVDLTGGLGIDCSYMAQSFVRADYVERQEVLCELALHNFKVLGRKHIQVHHQDGVAYLQQMAPVDCIFLDPARRDGHGGKTVAISDCEPNVEELEPVLISKAKQVWVKLSPMLDLTLALRALSSVQEVHIVSVNNECKELLLLLQKEGEGPVRVHCEHITSQKVHQHDVFTFQEEKETVAKFTSSVGHFLYEPNASLLKAGAYKLLTQRYPVQKLHVSSHLYTSDERVDDFPGRIFEVLTCSGFGKKELRTALQGVDKANLTIRNFPSSVADLRKRLKIKEGGDIYLFATTLSDEQKVLIKCKK